MPEINTHLPGGVLQRGALYEMSEAGPPSAERAALAALFVAGVLLRSTWVESRALTFSILAAVVRAR